MNRNRYFLIGVLLILLGCQFRLVQSVVLNEPTTRALARVTHQKPVASSDMMSAFLMDVSRPTKQISPPRWLGLASIAVGAVLTLHSIAMPRQ